MLSVEGECCLNEHSRQTYRHKDTMGLSSLLHQAKVLQMQGHGLQAVTPEHLQCAVQQHISAVDSSLYMTPLARSETRALLHCFTCSSQVKKHKQLPTAAHQQCKASACRGMKFQQASVPGLTQYAYKLTIHVATA